MKKMKIIKNVTLYKCSFCGKTYQLKRFAEQHHIACRKSPENTSQCSEYCKFLEKPDIKIKCSDYNGDYQKEFNSFYCTKKEIYLKPRWSTGIPSLYFCDTPEVKKMPKKCKKYESSL